jgi:hypothetical protein
LADLGDRERGVDLQHGENLAVDGVHRGGVRGGENRR